jgi:hypothetical protein
VRYLAGLDDAMAVIAEIATLEEVWGMHLANSDGKLGREHQRQADDIKAKHTKRLAKG